MCTSKKVRSKTRLVISHAQCIETLIKPVKIPTPNFFEKQTLLLFKQTFTLQTFFLIFFPVKKHQHFLSQNKTI